MKNLRNMKWGFSRPLARLLTCVLLCLLFSDCTRDAGQAVTIQFWAIGAEGDNIKALIPEFERKNPGIQVRVQALPWTAAHEKLLTAFAGNSMPDLFQLGTTWVPEFHLLSAIQDLRPWMAQSSTLREESYFPGIWATNCVDSGVFGIPWYVDTRVLFYRRDLLEAAGYAHPPTTWDEWKEVARAVKALGAKGGEGRYAILLPTNEWVPSAILGFQKGATFLKDRNTRGNFTDSSFVKAFEFYCSFFREGLAPVGITHVVNVYQGFAEGFFSMYVTGPWNVGEFRRRLPPDMQGKWMTAALPGPVGGRPGNSLAGGSSLVMSRTAEYKDAVWKLIEYLSEPDQQRAFYRITGNLPARKEVWNDSVLANDLYTHAFRVQLNHVTAPPTIPEWEQIAMKLQEAAEVGSVGNVPLLEVLNNLDRDVNVILAKRRWLLYGE